MIDPLSTNVKGVEFARGDRILGSDVLDIGPHRRPEGLFEPPDLSQFTFENRLHAAVRHVSHKARNLISSRELARRIAKSHPLNAA